MYITNITHIFAHVYVVQILDDIDVAFIVCSTSLPTGNWKHVRLGRPRTLAHRIPCTWRTVHTPIRFPMPCRPAWANKPSQLNVCARIFLLECICEQSLKILRRNSW